MKGTRAIVLLSALSVFAGAAAASSLSIQPASIDLDVAAGSDIDRVFEVSYRGDAPIVSEMEVDVEAETTNTEGLAVNLSPERFILDPGETRAVNLSIRSNHTLQPDNFSVSLNAATEIETETRTVTSEDDDDGGGGGGIDIGAFRVSTDEQGGTNSEESSDVSSDNENNLAEQVEELEQELRDERNRSAELSAELNETLNSTETANMTGSGDGSDKPSQNTDFIPGIFASFVRLVLPFL